MKSNYYEYHHSLDYLYKHLIHISDMCSSLIQFVICISFATYLQLQKLVIFYSLTALSKKEIYTSSHHI